MGGFSGSVLSISSGTCGAQAWHAGLSLSWPPLTPLAAHLPSFAACLPLTALLVHSFCCCFVLHTLATSLCAAHFHFVCYFSQISASILHLCGLSSCFHSSYCVDNQLTLHPSSIHVLCRRVRGCGNPSHLGQGSWMSI